MPQIIDFVDNMVVTEEHMDAIGTAANNTQAAVFGSTSRSQKPFCVVQKTNTETTPTAGAGDLKVTWNTLAVKDTDSMYDDVNKAIKAPVAGWYNIFAHLRFQTRTSSHDDWYTVYINKGHSITGMASTTIGSTSQRVFEDGANNAMGAGVLMNVYAYEYLNANDVVNIVVNTQNVAQVIDGSTFGPCRFVVEYVCP